jgi:hypothetical protein
MNTAEMWIKAQIDGKIYENIDGEIAYSKDRGLIDKYDFTTWKLGAWDWEEKNALDSLMNCRWRVMDNVMTIEEAEERFGIKIIAD